MDSKFLYLNSVDPTKITCKIKEKFSKLTLSSKKKLTETINNDKDENKDLINHASRNLDYKLLTDDDSDNEIGFLNKLLRSETTEDTNQSAKSIEKSIFSEKLQISDSDDTFCSMEGENIQKDELKHNATSLIPEGQTTLTNMLDNKIAKSNNSNRPFDTVSSIPNSIKLKLLTEDVQSNDRESSQIVSTTSLRKSSCYKTSPEFLVGTTDDRISINKSLIVISSTEASPCRNSVNISDNTSGYDKTEEVIILTDSEEETVVSIGQYQRHVSENLSIDKFELGTTLTRVKAERIQKFLKDVQANQIRIANAETESMTGSVSDKVSNIQLKQPNVHIASDETQSMHESVFERAVESLTDITGTKINVPEKKPIHGASYKQIAEQDTESMQSCMVMTEQNKNANQSLHTSSSVPDESLTIAETSSENENYENHVPLNSSTSDSKFPTNSQTIRNTNTNNDELSNQIQISESIENAETSEVDQISDRIRNINISAKKNIKIQITGQFEEDSSSSLEDNEISGRDSKRTSLQSADNYNSCSSAHENIQSESIKTPKLPKFSQKPDIVHCPLILSSNPKEICNVTPDKTKIVQNESPLNDSSSKNNTSACTPKQTKINKDIVNDEYLKTANLLTKLYGETWKTPDIIKTLKKQSNTGKKNPENKYDEIEFSKLTLSSKKKLTETINNDKDENKDLINHASRNLDYKLLTDDDSDNEIGFLNKLLRSETTEDTNQSAKSIEKSIFSEKLQISDSDDTFCSMEGENIQKDELKHNATSLIPEGQTTLTNMLDNKIAKSNNSNRPFDTVSSIPNSIKLKLLTEDVQSNDRESSQIVSTTSLRKSSCYKTSPEFLVGTTDDRISINKSLIVISSTEASPCRNSVNISDNTSGYDKTEEVIILTDSEEETVVSIGQYQRHVSENLSIDKFELGTTLTRVKAERIQKFLKDVQANQIRIANAETESMTGSVSDKVSNIQLKQPNVHIASDETQSMHESVFERAVESLTDITGTKINVPEKKPIHGASYKQIAEQDTESMQSCMVMTEQNKNANQSLHTSSSVPDESLTIAETSSENENYENHVPLNSSTSDSKFPTNSQTIRNTNTNNDELSNQIQISESIENAETSEVDQISDRIRNINISAKKNIKIQITGQFEEDSSSSLEDNEISGRDSKRTSLQSADNYNSCSSAHENIQSESIKTPKLPKFSQKPDIVHCPLILSSNPKEICNVTPDKTKIVQNESPLNDSSSKNNTSACTPKQTKINKDIVNDEYLKTANLLTKLYGETWKTPDIIKTLKKQSNTGKKNPENKYDESILDDFSMFQKNIPNNLELTRLGQTFKRPPIKPINDIKSRSLKKTINKKFNSNLMENNGLENTTKFIVTKNGRRVKPRFQNITASETESEEISDNSFSIETDSESSLELGLGGKTTTRRGKRTTKKNPNHNKFVLLDLTNDEIKVVKRMDKTPPVKGDYLPKLLDSCTYEKPNMVSTPTTVRTKRKLFTPRFGSDDEVVPVDSPRKPHLSSSDEEKENVKLIAPLPFNFHPINKKLESVRTGQPIFKLSTPKSDSKKNTVQKETPIKNKPIELTTSNSSAKRGNRVIEKIADTPENKYGFLKSLDVFVSKSLCHPDALFYRDNYRQKKVELADKLYEIYNTMCFKNELNVPLAWNKKLLTTAGRCKIERKGNLRFSVVELSEKVLTSADRLRCTLIHELCHAATWIFNGERGHGATWKSWACKANQTFPELPKIRICHQYDIEYKYTYKCTLCGARSHAHSKSKNVENIRCTCCHGTIEIFLNKKDKTGNIVQTPVKSPKAFAKFVKEKYRDFKGPNVKHSEVMKLLSAAYAEINLEEKKND